MAVAGPHRVAFSRHAAARAERAGRSLTAIADLVLDGHPARTRNHGAGDWAVTGAGLTVVYDWPDDDDPHCARVITVWVTR